MSKAVRILRVILLAVVVLVGFHGVSAAQTLSASILGFQVTFGGIEYNPVADETKFTYTVVATPDATTDLSSFALAFCQAQQFPNGLGGILKTSHPASLQTSAESDHTGLTWLMFEPAAGGTGEYTFWFVLKGQWGVADVGVALGAGSNMDSTWLAGPACSGASCHVQYIVSHSRVDLRAMQPGTYGSLLTSIYLKGTTAVTLRFSEFGDAGHLDNPFAPSVPVEYSLGLTLADAEAYGWRTVQQWNSHEFHVPVGDVQDGTIIAIWARTMIGANNYSADYEGRGKVSLILDCP